jgi:ATP-dependent exoDNAse (exonuclease V) beta subunit
MLKDINKHPRDNLIKFEEIGHRYTYNNVMNPISVTTIIHHYFPKFDADKIIDKMMASKKWPSSEYYGMAKEEIKKQWSDNGRNASQLGTTMHASIEDYFNLTYPIIPEPTENHTPEFIQFLTFWKTYNSKFPEWRPYRTEWVVYDEDKKLAGSIDMTLCNDAGQINIMDWKRSKKIERMNSWQRGFGPFSHLDDCNFNHYTLQLNIYRHILETKYNKQIVGLYLVICHPNQTSAQFLPVDKKVDEIAALWNLLPLRTTH